MTTAKQRVRGAAVRLFALKGYYGTGIRELAEAAGLSSASLYHYMGTKEDLLVEIMTDSLERLLVVGRRLVDDAGGPDHAICRLVQLHVVTHALLPEQTAVVDNELRALSEAGRAPVGRLRDAYERLWQEAIEAGCKEGVFAAAHPSLVRLGLLELCTGVARWYSPAGPLPLAEVAQSHVEMAYGMLGVKAPARRRKSLPPVDPVLDVVAAEWGLTVP